MTTEYTGTGDPAKSLELLWGTKNPPSRGPRPALTVERIVAAAIEVAGAEGWQALSMRRVADALGVGTMTLYRYVPGKGELLDLMMDAAFGELDRRPHEGTWRERLDRVARANWELCHRHPWLLNISMSRPVLGPNVLAKYDHELGAVDGLGLSEMDMDAILTLVLSFAAGAARVSVEQSQAPQRTGMTDEQWWNAHAPILERLYKADEYPLAQRVGTVVGEAMQAAYDAGHAFEFGLARVLDGIEVYIEDAAG
ncbi:TetR/AcrR family transcriptional regulator [Longispora albida]|uniref:TetR/AcrR family transcriptional regulator n=1 Tax=Longispora albida TaxID=203523 RepID=UPI0003822758|nr:TetR/AcrR family transcriptional regulator [Longispora albida]